jgi:hypothetical protein
MTTQKVLDIPFKDASDITSIQYRLAPLDVGFDIRLHKIDAGINRSDDPIRVSYETKTGERRVISGPQPAVLSRLRKHGYRFRRN